MKNTLVCFCMLFCLVAELYAQQPDFLFKNNREGYNLYRIPTVISTPSGKLLAFCEGRKTLFDGGDIDLVMKSSEDDGKTWSPLKVIWNDGNNTCGNPSPVYDYTSRAIVLMATRNNDEVFVLRSLDEGSHWEEPVNITESVKPENWKWYASGPGHAIQMERGQYKNRILVPCNHTLKGIDKHISHVLFSDDGGKTWQRGGSVASEDTDECTLLELADGNLLLNMRNGDRSLPNRKISISSDGGSSWTVPAFDSSLVEPVCQGALLRYSFNPDILLFSNPKHKKYRRNLTLSISFDGGNSWPKSLSLFKRKSAYNDLVKLKNGDLLCLFETGKVLPYGGIAIRYIKKEDILPNE